MVTGAYDGRMSWTWDYESAGGHTAPASPSFPAQADAETWIGESWQELLEQGVDSVTLREDDRVVYGGMSLHPADPQSRSTEPPPA